MESKKRIIKEDFQPYPYMVRSANSTKKARLYLSISTSIRETQQSWCFLIILSAMLTKYKSVRLTLGNTSKASMIGRVLLVLVKTISSLNGDSL